MAIAQIDNVQTNSASENITMNHKMIAKTHIMLNKHHPCSLSFVNALIIHEVHANTSTIHRIISINVQYTLGAHIVIIIGDGKIAGEKYDSREHTLLIAEKLKWKLVEEKYTELDKTSRNFQQSFRTKGKKEYFLVFEKPEEV